VRQRWQVLGLTSPPTSHFVDKERTKPVFRGWAEYFAYPSVLGTDGWMTGRTTSLQTLAPRTVHSKRFSSGTTGRVKLKDQQTGLPGKWPLTSLCVCVCAVSVNILGDNFCQFSYYTCNWFVIVLNMLCFMTINIFDNRHLCVHGMCNYYTCLEAIWVDKLMTIHFMETSRFCSRTTGRILSEIQPIGLLVKWLLTDVCTMGTCVL